MAVKLGYQNVYRDPLGYPEWYGRGLPVEIAPAGLSGMSEEPEPRRPIYGWTMIWTLLGIFAGGMALNLTPCVYPLIPITVSYFGGRSGKGQLIGHGLCYIGGLSITNSVLGVVAALTGGLMGAMLQNPFVLAAVAVILIFFCFQPFWLLGIAAAKRPHASSIKILCWLFRDVIHGDNAGSGCCSLYRPLCFRIAYLGSKYG